MSAATDPSVVSRRQLRPEYEPGIKWDAWLAGMPDVN